VNGLPGEETAVSKVAAPPGYPERSYHALVAGAVGGYFVWGRYSSVNYQIVLYLASRVALATWKRLSHYDQNEDGQHSRIYPWAAAAIWGVVMMLFEETPQVLHPSLKSSMDEIYRYSCSSISTQGNEQAKTTDGDVRSNGSVLPTNDCP